MKAIVTISCFFLCFHLVGQSTYFIRDQYLHEAIPFAKIMPTRGNPVLADIDGAFQVLDSLENDLKIVAFGYVDTIIQISKVENYQIFLVPISKQLEEVTVVPGENPAHRIMDLVIENRKKNNPTDNESFRYDSYSKFVFDINQEASSSISDTTTDKDLIKMRDFMNSQHLFLIENASRRTFVPPSRDKEEIIAYKTSGFSDPLFSTFANEMQSFSFYENQFELLGKTYINPIALGGTKRYLFILEDTTVVGLDTTFTISFRPRKGKVFEGLKGRLFINTNGYAIEKVITESVEAGTMPLKIIQEYSFINGERWFPSKLSTELSMPNFLLSTKNIKNQYLVGKGSTYIKNIEFNPKGIKKYSFDNATISVADKANDVKEKDWDTMRVYSITEKEKKTYHILDSISKAENLDYKLTLMKTLLEGKVPLGYFNLDVPRIYDFKLYEGNRFGLGVETSKKMLKKATIGGYFGYGTNDKEWKYGGYSSVSIYKRKGVKLRFAYQQDLAERGGSSFQKDVFNLNSPDLLRHLYITNMDRQRLGEIALSGLVTSNFKVTLVANYQRISPTKGYLFLPTNPSIYTYSSDYDLAETSLEINWNIHEKVIQLGDVRVSKGTSYPKIGIQITKGWKNWVESNYDYWRIHVELAQDFSVRNAGKLSWLISGGQTIGDVPLYLSQLALGTGKKWNISIKNTFETMRPSEFFSNQQASFFTRFTFNTIKTSKSWCKPHFGLHHAIGYGTMKNTSEHFATFKTLEKGFYEGGLVVDHLFINGFSGFGMGVFYRYGSYAHSNWQENLVFKIRISFTI